MFKQPTWKPTSIHNYAVTEATGKMRMYGSADVQSGKVRM